MNVVKQTRYVLILQCGLCVSNLLEEIEIHTIHTLSAPVPTRFPIGLHPEFFKTMRTLMGHWGEGQLCFATGFG